MEPANANCGASNVIHLDLGLEAWVSLAASTLPKPKLLGLIRQPIKTDSIPNLAYCDQRTLFISQKLA